MSFNQTKFEGSLLKDMGVAVFVYKGVAFGTFPIPH